MCVWGVSGDVCGGRGECVVCLGTVEFLMAIV